MAQIGQYAQLLIVKFVDFGAYLDAGKLGTILLPKRYLNDQMSLGDPVDVFIHLDSNDIPVATTLKPRACVGQSAYLPWWISTMPAPFSTGDCPNTCWYLLTNSTSALSWAALMW